MYRSNTNINVSNVIFPFKRLHSGQETFKLPKCPCTAKKTLPSTPPNRYYNQTSQKWQNGALTDGDERSGVFCTCGGNASNAAAVNNRLELSPESTNRPNETEHYPAYSDGTNEEGFNRPLEPLPESRDKTSIRPSSDYRVSTVKVHLNEDKKEKKRRKVKGGRRKRTKNKCTQVVQAEESITDISISKKAMLISQAIYPGVNCGHKNCASTPIITPKTMGWLWSLRETGGVKINRNWRPGAIPTSVKLVMDQSRGYNTDDIDSFNLTATPTTLHNDQYPSSDWSGTTVESNKKYLKSRRSVVMSDSQKTLQFQNNNNANTTNDEPVFSMNKHNGQYGIQMNPMPYKDQNGELVYPKNIEPVHIRLGRRNGKDATISSQSSMDIDLIPHRGLNKAKL